MEYVRIGTAYYKKVRKPLASGDAVEFLLPWSTECIKQDRLSDIQDWLAKKGFRGYDTGTIRNVFRTPGT